MNKKNMKNDEKVSLDTTLDYIVENGCLTHKPEFFTKQELEYICEKLFCNWFDIRKTLDEQIHCNTKMCNNFFFYEAREAEAKAKYLYFKAELMTRK